MGIVYIFGAVLEPIMRPLFNLPGCGSFPFAMGIVSGYPVGAKTTAELRKKGLCTVVEGERLLTFCNNSGPLFILGAVAVGIFKNSSVGFILYLAHFMAAISVGLCFRFYKYSEKNSIPGKNQYKTNKLSKFIGDYLKRNIGENQKSFGEIFGDAIANAVNSLLIICGFIIFFAVLIKILDSLKILSLVSKVLGFFLIPLGMPRELVPSIAAGFFEITTGIRLAGECTSVSLIHRIIAASLILGWAGISVHCQVIAIIKDTDMHMAPYLLGKAMQSIFSALYSFLLLRLAPINTDVFRNIMEPFTKGFRPDILSSFCLSLIFIGNVLLFITFLCFVLVITNKVIHRK